MFLCYNNEELPKMDGGREFIPHLMETFMIEYDSSNDLRTVKSTGSTCPMRAHSDYQSSNRDAFGCERGYGLYTM